MFNSVARITNAIKPRRLAIGNILPVGLVVSYFFVILLAFRKVPFDGTIGLNGDWPIPPFPEQIVDNMRTDIFYAWSPNRLGFEQVRQTGNYVDILAGLLALLFRMGGPVYSRYPLLLMALSGVSLYFAGRRLGLSIWSSYVGGLFYMLTPFAFNSFVNGYLKFFVCYAILPVFFVYLLALVSATEFDLGLFAKTAFFYGLVSTQIPFFFLGGVLIFSYLVYEIACYSRSWRESGRKITRTVLLIMGPLLLQPTPFLRVFSGFLGLAQRGVAQQFGAAQALWLAFQSPDLFHALSLIGGGVRFFFETIQSHDVLFGWWEAIRMIVVSLVFGALLLKRKSKMVIYLAVMSIITLFLLKGVREPFGQLYKYLYMHVPFMAIIRNVQYITFISALCYALLIGYSIDELMRWLSERTSLTSERFRLLSVVMVATTGLILLNGFPFLTGDFGGFVQTYEMGEDVKKVYDTFRDDTDDYRLLWLPAPNPVTYRASKFAGHNPIVWYPPKPSLYDRVTDPPNAYYEVEIFNSLMQPAYQNHLGALLSLANVRYAVMNHDFESKYAYFVISEPALHGILANQPIDHMIKQQKDMVWRETVGAIDVYENMCYTPSRVYTTNDMLFVAGNFSDFVALQGAEQRDCEPRQAVFASQLGPEDQALLERVNRVAIFDDEYLSLVSSLIPVQYHIQPGNYVNVLRGDANEEWAPLLGNWWWYDPNYNTLGNGITTLGSNQVTIPFQAPETGRYQIWAKVYVGPKGSAIVFVVDNKRVGLTETRSTAYEGFQWLRIGAIQLDKGHHSVWISSSLGENVIARMLIAPESILEQALQQASRFLSNASYPVTNVFRDPRNTFYVPGEDHYTLWAKVGPNVQKSNLYLFPEQTDWGEEIRRWQVAGRRSQATISRGAEEQGSRGEVASSPQHLSTSAPPLVFYGSSWHGEERDHHGGWRWGTNNMHLLVFNPNSQLLQGTLTFHITTIRERELEVAINGQLVKSVHLPANYDKAPHSPVDPLRELITGNKLPPYEPRYPPEWTTVTLEGITLQPGVNEVVLYTRPETDVMDDLVGNEDKREVSIQLWDDIRFRVSSPKSQVERERGIEVQKGIGNAQYEMSVVNGRLVLDVYFDGDAQEQEFVLMEREFQGGVNLEEYPFFRLLYTVSDPDVATVDAAFGIDYPDDGQVDGHVIASSTKTDEGMEISLNLFEAAKERFPDPYYKERRDLKLVRLFLIPHKQWGLDASGEKKGLYRFTFGDLQIYNDQSLALPAYTPDLGRATYVPQNVDDRRIPYPVKSQIPMTRAQIEALFNWPLVKIDGKPVEFKPPAGSIFDRNGYWLEPQNIFLTEGMHSLEILEHPTFKVDLVEVANKPYEPKEPRARVDFRKINPTRYNVTVDAQEPFWLVFSESFHEGWKASIVDGGEADKEQGKRPWYEWSALLTWFFGRGRRTELTEHYLVNGYANGWYVPETGQYRIVLEFWPQRLFEIGMVISSVTFLACVCYLVVDWRKGRR